MNLENIKEILDFYFSEDKVDFEKLHKNNIMATLYCEDINNDTSLALQEVENLPITEIKSRKKINGGDAEEYETETINHDPLNHIFYNLLLLKKDYEKKIEDKVQYKMNLSNNSKIQQSHL